MPTFAGGDHPSDQELLACADGGLSPAATRRTQAHLKACWECRGRLAKIESAIERVVDLRREWSASEAQLPPAAANRFERRLDELEAEMPKRSFGWPAFRLPAMPRGPSWALRAAAAALAVIAVWLWFGVQRPETVSAAEFLERMESYQEAALRNVPDPVVHREMRLRVGPEGGGESATLEYWAVASDGRGHRAGEQALWRQVTEVFEANRMAEVPPLSAGSYQSWRAAAHPSRELVRLAADSSARSMHTLFGETSGVNRPKEILEHELAVRASDWHPLRQTLLVREEQGPVKYEFTEVAYSVLRPRDLPPEIRASLELPGGEDTVQPGQPAPVQPAPPVMALFDPAAEAEVRVWYRLHLLDGCRQDIVEVRRTDAGLITVRGVVETAVRRAEIEAALREDAPASTELDLHSLEEAANAEELVRALQGLELRQSAPKLRTVAPGGHESLAITPMLRQHYAAVAGARGPALAEAEEHVIETSNAALRTAHQAYAEAAALSRLAARFGGDEADWSPVARRMLNRMLRDHTEALGQHLREQRSALTPVLEAVPEGSAAAGGETLAGREESRAEWPDAARSAFAAAERLHRLTSDLFAANAGLTEVRATAAELMGVLTDLESGVERLAASLDIKTRAEAQTASAAAGRE